MCNGRRLMVAVSLFVASIGSGGVEAQVLSVSDAPGFPVVRIDVTSGAIQSLVSTGVTSAYGGLNAFDPSGHRLFFLTGGVGTQELVTVDITTGSVTLVAIPSASSYVSFEFDQTTGSVLAVTNAPGTPVVAINPATGVVQTVVVTNEPVPSASTIDGPGRELYLMSGATGSQVLVTVDLTTNAVSSVAIPRTDDYILFEFDPADDRIVAVTNGPGYPVLSIDPGTGFVASLVDTGATSAQTGLSAFDVASRRLFFLSTSGGSRSLFTVDLDSLSVTSISLPMAPPAFIFFEVDFAALIDVPTLSRQMLALLAMVLGSIACWIALREGAA